MIPKTIGTRSEWNITSLANTTFHEAYHPLFEINSFLNQLSNAHPNITSLLSLGHSAEGRDMTALAISTGPYKNQGIGGKRVKKGNRKNHEIKAGVKLGFVLVGAQHAREVRVSRQLAYGLLYQKYSGLQLRPQSTLPMPCSQTIPNHIRYLLCSTISCVQDFVVVQSIYIFF